MSCFDSIKPSLPCAKFLIAVIISLSTTIFACCLLGIHGFADCNLTSFCTSLITMNITYWLESPSPGGQKNNDQNSSGQLQNL